MKALKGRLWTGTHRGNRKEGDLNRRGEIDSQQGTRRREELG
jgi:hypothetical protein